MAWLTKSRFFRLGIEPRRVSGRKRATGERGDLAVAIAIVVVMLLTLIPLAAYAAAVNQLPLARGEQSYQAALAAAQAGVADYVNRLNQTALNQAGNYWIYSSSKTPPGGNAALTGWAQVPGTTDEYFHYTPDISSTSSTGIVTLTVVGASGTGTQARYRTIRVQLRTDGFLNYLLLTDKMLIDPTFAPYYAGFGSSSSAASECAYKYSQPNDNASGVDSDDSYFYDPGSTLDSYSTGPEWNQCAGLINYYVTGQTFNGPIMTNDMYYMNGTPKFLGRVYSGSATTSGSTSHPYWVDPIAFGKPGSILSTDKPSFATKGDPAYHTPINLPSSNSALESAAQVGGCVYYGQTNITFNSDGTMSASVTNSKASNTLSNLDTPGCLGSHIALPSNGVIYVANTTPSSSCPQNSSSSVSTSIVGGGQISGCSNGDAFVQGYVTSQVTVGADNDIFVTGNLEDYNCLSSNNQILGLIANNFILVGNAFSSTNTTPDICTWGTKTSTVKSNNPVIMAGILTLSHSFAAMNFWNVTGKALGTIYIEGSLAGNYADIEGTFSSGGGIIGGYATNYSYDARLQYLTPPFFLSPVGGQWIQIAYGETGTPTGLPALP